MTSSPSTAADRQERIAQLLARTALADQRAFAELYQHVSAPLYGIALRILRESSAAEEVLQDVFVSVWHHAGTYTAVRSQPMTWLSSIVRHRCLDYLRRRELETVSMTRDTGDEADQPDLDFASDAATPMELLVAGAESRSVRQCVETLEGGQKQAIALAFFQGLSHAELAQHLQQPLGTIKSWIRRGLERLRECLDRSGYVH